MQVTFKLTGGINKSNTWWYVYLNGILWGTFIENQLEDLPGIKQSLVTTRATRLEVLRQIDLAFTLEARAS